jgi:hypothetical protein
LDGTTGYLPVLTDNRFVPEHRTSPETELDWQLLDAFRKLFLEEQRYIIAQLDLMMDLLTRPAHRVIGGDTDEAPQTGRDQTADTAQVGP